MINKIFLYIILMLKLGVTTTEDLYNLAKRLNYKILVISKDQVYNLKNNFYIINLNNSNEPGSHWVSLIINNNILYYWDSFGCPPFNEIIKLNHKIIYYNQYTIQDINDSNCGWYCLFFLYHMKHYKNDYKKMLELFIYNNEKNSDILEKFFNKFI